MSTPSLPGPASGRRRQRARLIGRWAPAAVLLGLLVLAWQVVAVHNAYLVPRIGAILAQLADHPGEFLAAAAVTLSESGVGLGASFVIAFSLAVAMSYIPVVERAVMPLAVILNVTPGRQPRSRVRRRLRVHDDAALPGDRDNRVLPPARQLACGASRH